MKILHISPSFYPATYWGGPIFSVLGLCDALVSVCKVDLHVITTDTAGPRRTDNLIIKANPAIMPAGYSVHYCHRIIGASVSISLLAEIWKQARKADVVHLTSVYSFPTIPTLIVTRLLNKPLVWSPRGSLQVWQGSTRPLMKRLWTAVCNLLIFKKRSVLHVTSEEERAASESRIHVKSALIPNGVEVPLHLPPREWTPDGALRLLFIGRIHPKKGIENLLLAIKLLKDEKVILSVYGSGDKEYLDSLAGLVKAHGLENQIRFCGHADGDNKLNAFMAADMCVVPSFTENFGMVVAEALAHGVPVIVSKGAPWKEVETHGCGLWVDNSPEPLADAVVKMAELDLEAMGMRGRNWMVQEYSWDSVAKRMFHLYEQLHGSNA